MPKSTQTPAAARRLIFAMVGELTEQTGRTQAAQGKPTFEAELATLAAMADSFEAMARSIYRERFNKDAGEFDYCPEIDAPSIGEIKKHLNELVLHIDSFTNKFLGYQCMTGLVMRAANFAGAVDWLAGDFEPGVIELDGVEAEAAATPNTARDGVVDLSHRLSPLGFEHGTLGLLDTINTAADKALSILTMLSNHFAIDDDNARPSDETIYFALQAVNHELEDIKAFMDGFHRLAANDEVAIE